jgi:UDP-N-acetylglucosamine 2-epimerase
LEACQNFIKVVPIIQAIHEEIAFTKSLGIPCVPIRESLVRFDVVKCGTNVIAGASVLGIHKMIARHLSQKNRVRTPDKWKRKTDRRFVSILTYAVRK